PDRGQDTTPANERRYSNEHLASVFEKTEAIAKKMDALGYDTLWLAEHHFQHEGYECIPNDLMLAVHLAHVTKQIKIGCAFNIAPMWHPLRLAEDYATADILTGGRSSAGSQSSAPTPAGSISWSSTASKVRSAAARQRCRRGRSPATATRRRGSARI